MYIFQLFIVFNTYKQLICFQIKYLSIQYNALILILKLILILITLILIHVSLVV